MPCQANKDCIASIIISSYNYDRYLSTAINSALTQTYKNKEVIVVDDGSTDGSRDIISGYGSRIVAVLKDNGGQASAFNAGVNKSSGEVIFFLDSDDVMLMTAVEQAVSLFVAPDVIKVHWPLEVIDESGTFQKRIVPSVPVDEGNLMEAVAERGPAGYTWPPTSGSAWARHFIDSVHPIPENDYKICPDLYLSALAPLYGRVRRIVEPQGLWRVHGDNASTHQPLHEWVRHQVRLWESCFNTLKCRGMEKGKQIDTERLRASSWWHKVAQTIREMVSFIPADEKLILIDDYSWGPRTDIAGRLCIPFLERDGSFFLAYPQNDLSAIQEVERLRRFGAGFIVIVWASFWWLGHYPGLNQHLRERYHCLVENERVVIFDLRPHKYSGCDEINEELRMKL
jgi:hypothetical protein